MVAGAVASAAVACWWVLTVRRFLSLSRLTFAKPSHAQLQASRGLCFISASSFQSEGGIKARAVKQREWMVGQVGAASALGGHSMRSCLC